MGGRADPNGLVGWAEPHGQVGGRGVRAGGRVLRKAGARGLAKQNGFPGGSERGAERRKRRGNALGDRVLL